MQSKSAGCEAAGRVPCLSVNEGRFPAPKNGKVIYERQHLEIWDFGEHEELESTVAASCSLLHPREHDCHRSPESFP